MHYFSAEEKARLAAELEQRLTHRKALQQRLEAARELGDLRENAEYHAAREDQGFNESRIRELVSRLASAVVTDDQDVPENVVFLGATVRLRDVENGDEGLYRLVGDAGVAPTEDVIEVTPNSPMGEALMKSRVGEVIRVTLRRGARRFEIVAIV